MEELTVQIITLADLAIISREGKLSIVGMFDELRVQRFPGGLARAFFVATLKGKPGTAYSLGVQVSHKDKIINTINIDIATSPNGKNNILFELVNFGVEEAGDYNFDIMYKEKSVGQFTLSVYQQQAPGAKLGGTN